MTNARVYTISFEDLQYKEIHQNGFKDKVREELHTELDLGFTLLRKQEALRKLVERRMLQR